MESIKGIKSGPYWRVNIRPVKFDKNRISSLSEVRNILEQCKVSLRGWDFPHINIDYMKNGSDYVQSELTSNDIKEFWRFYQSAQFVHYFSVYEDYSVKAGNRDVTSIWSQSTGQVKPSGFVEILTTLYRMTEIYEFAIRLAQKKVFDEGTIISITMAGIQNFRLFFWDSSRTLFKDYISGISEIDLESKMTVQELIVNGHKEALQQAINVYERFNWNNPNKEIFAEEQKKLLERRL